MRLIDADALMAEITEENPLVHFGPFGYAACSPDSGFGEKVFMRDRVLEIVESAPTVDAVAVVRCKDCKCSDHFRCGIDGVLFCMEHSRFMVYDNFCSYGERKGGASND